MSREKNNYKKAVSAFFEGAKLYFQFIDKFIIYLTFPVMGQVISSVILLTLTYFYALNLKNWVGPVASPDNMLLFLVLFLIILIPFFFVLCKAVCDYLIAMASLNSIANNLVSKSKNKVLDTKIHDELIKRRGFSYFSLIFILGIIYSIGFAIPVFWIPAVLFVVYASLSLQVFALEENTNSFSAIKRSFVLVKGNFWATTLLLVLLCIATFIVIPNLIVWACDQVSLTTFFTAPTAKFVGLFPINEANQFLHGYNISYTIKPDTIALNIVRNFISQIVMMYALPLRSCACTIWYKYLDDEKIDENRRATKLDGRKELKKIIKRSSKKEST